MLSHTLLRFVRAGRGDAYATNAWIGPPGTVSPLHRDPTDNLLAQLYGEKRVLLYSERDIDRDSMSGTSSHVLSIYSMLLRTLLPSALHSVDDLERHESGPLRALAVASDSLAAVSIRLALFARVEHVHIDFYHARSSSSSVRTSYRVYCLPQYLNHRCSRSLVL